MLSFRQYITPETQFPRITFSGSWRRPFAPVLWVYATGAMPGLQDSAHREFSRSLTLSLSMSICVCRSTMYSARASEKPESSISACFISLYACSLSSLRESTLASFGGLFLLLYPEEPTPPRALNVARFRHWPFGRRQPLAPLRLLLRVRRLDYIGPHRLPLYGGYHPKQRSRTGREGARGHLRGVARRGGGLPAERRSLPATRG